MQKMLWNGWMCLESHLPLRQELDLDTLEIPAQGRTLRS